jgi:hypothetical protein
MQKHGVAFLTPFTPQLFTAPSSSSHQCWWNKWRPESLRLKILGKVGLVPQRDVFSMVPKAIKVQNHVTRSWVSHYWPVNYQSQLLWELQKVPSESNAKDMVTKAELRIHWGKWWPAGVHTWSETTVQSHISSSSTRLESTVPRGTGKKCQTWRVYPADSSVQDSSRGRWGKRSGGLAYAACLTLYLCTFLSRR